MQNASRLLVVTPTLGKSHYLERCVDLIKAFDFDLIHVLSCPAAVVAELQARFPTCRVVPDAGRQGGMYEAINAGIRAGIDECGFFTYINDDDELAPGFATMFHDFGKPENTSKISYGDTLHIDAEGKSMGRISVERNQRNFLPLVISKLYPFTQQGMVTGAGILKKIGHFNSGYRHVADLDFSVRCMRGGFEFCYYPIEVARFRLHAGQLSGNRDEVHDEYAILHKQLEELRISAARRLLCRFKYRIANIPRYIERVRSVGWMSTEEMTGKPLASRVGSE